VVVLLGSTGYPYSSSLMKFLTRSACLASLEQITMHLSRSTLSQATSQRTTMSNGDLQLFL